MLFQKEILVDIKGAIFNDWWGFVFVLLGGLGGRSISHVGENNENKELQESDPSFNLVDFLIHKNNPNPNVGPN